ncbi:hypothetical protein L1856_06700 [Streptomyces sp. Tue 6430]|nr:hypothetical protein [Streptomyces sp. Tue 6430]
MYGAGTGTGAYGLPVTTGADKSSYFTPSPSAHTNTNTNTNAYRDSFLDDPDTDTVFSALTPSVTAGPGTDRSADTGDGLPVNRPATVGSAVPGPSPSRTGGGDSVPDETGRQRSTDDDTTRFTSEGRQQPDPQAPLAPTLHPSRRPRVPGPRPPGPASPGSASPNAAPQQRPQTTPSGDPAVAVEPSDPVSDPLAPEEGRTPSPGDSEGSGPSSAVPKAETTRTPSDTPSPHRSVRTESEELPAGADSPAEPDPAVSREVPHTRPGAVDETPLSSRAPAEILTGNPSGPGSPDSVDMIMDWEDGQDDSGLPSDLVPDLEPDPVTEALYDRLLTDVFGPTIGTSPSTPPSATP